MKKTILIIVSFILFTYSFLACVKGAGTMEEAGGLFPLLYNFIAGDADVAYSVAVDSLNNIIVAGLDRMVDSGQWRVMKFDSDGNEYSPPLWPYIVNPTDGYDEPKSVAVDSARNIIVVGREEPIGAFGRWGMRKVDENGLLIWTKSEDFPPLSGENYKDQAEDVAVDSNNNIIVVGYDQQEGWNLGNWRVIKYDNTAAGNEIFNRQYPSSEHSIAYGVAIQSDGSIIVVGTEKTATTKNDWRIKKLNPLTGDVDINCDKIILSTLENDMPVDVAVDSLKNIIVVGYEGVTTSDSKWKIIKLDPNCNEIGSWDGDWSPQHDQIRSVAVDYFNNIIVVGSDKNPVDDMKWRIMKFGSSLPLTVLWQDTVNPTSPAVGEWDNERANGVAVVDGVAPSKGVNIIVVGSDDSPLPDDERKWRIMKYRANEDCYNGEDDDLDGCTDCEDYNCPGDSRQECPPDASCGTCYHLECNYLGVYDWSCQPDPADTICSGLIDCTPPGQTLTAICDPVTGGLARFYTPDDYDRCDGFGVCVPYVCSEIDSYCTDNDQFDGVDSFMCGATCDEETNCPQTTWNCDTTQRRYGTRDQYGICDSMCSCQLEPFTYGPQDDVNYCNNCAHYPDGACNCDEDLDPGSYPDDCGQCQYDYQCDDGNECTVDRCVNELCNFDTYEPDGTSCTGTPGRCCSGQCDNDGIITGSGYHSNCRSNLQCIAPADWGYTAANQGLDCDAPIPYCSNQLTCNSLERYHYCDTGYCNGEWGTEQESSANACNGLACGPYIDYCADAYTCDSKRYRKTCDAELSCNGPNTPDEESSANACNGLACGAWIPYCSDQSTCNSKERRNFCTAEGVTGCTGEWDPIEQDPIGTACQGLDCGTCCICGSNEDRTADLSGLQDVDCNGNDAAAIATCTNTPDDSYGMTWDYRAAFDSQCLGVDSCSVVDPEVENTCADDDFYDGVDPGNGQGCTADCDQPEDCPGGTDYGICGPADRPTECICAHCHFCAGGSGDTSTVCYLPDDTVKAFSGVYDYEYYWYETDSRESMDYELFATGNPPGNYEICATRWSYTCPTELDPTMCEDAGIPFSIGNVDPVDDPFWLLVHRKDNSGEPGYTIKVMRGPVLPNPNTCDETDNRKYQLRGKVYGYKDGSEYEYWDSCQDGRRLEETYCDGPTPRSEIYDCKNLGSDYRCSLGECISAKEEKKPKKLDLLDVLTQTLRGIFGLDKWF